MTLDLSGVKLGKFGRFLEFFLLSKLQINKSIRAMRLSFRTRTSIYLISLALNAVRSADFDESMAEWLDIDTRFFLSAQSIRETSAIYVPSQFDQLFVHSYCIFCHIVRRFYDSGVHRLRGHLFRDLTVKKRCFTLKQACDKCLLCLVSLGAALVADLLFRQES